MKGFRCFTLSRKFYIIFLLFFVPLFALLNVIDVSAVTKDYAGFKLRLRYRDTSSYVLTSDLLYGQQVQHVDRVDGVRVEVNSVGAVPTNTNHVIVTGKLNLVVLCRTMIITGDLDDLANRMCPHNTSTSPEVYAVAVNGSSVNFTSASISTYITNWRTYNPNPSVNDLYRTFTYEFSFIINSGIPTNITTLAFFFTYEGALDNANYDNFTYFFEGDLNNRMIIDYTTDSSNALAQQQIQLQSVANQYLEQIAQQSQQDAADRDELQNTSDESSTSADDLGDDAEGAGEQLLYVLTNFYGLFLNPPSSDCKVSMGTLFNQYKVGTYSDADLCSLSPPPAVSILATLLLIGLVIPFAVSAISTLIKLLEGVYTT